VWLSLGMGANEAIILPSALNHLLSLPGDWDAGVAGSEGLGFCQGSETGAEEE
jgi:hypothetical protein